MRPLPSLRLRRVLPCVLLLVVIAGTPLRAQPDEPFPGTVDGIIDEVLPPDDEVPDDPELLDELEEYLAHPIDLLTTTADLLARLPGITGSDAEEILDYIDSTAPSRMEELDSLGWLTPEQRVMLHLFTTLGHPAHEPPPGLRLAVRSRITSDMQTRRGYGDTVYAIRPARNAAGDSLGLDTLPGGHSYLGSRIGIRQRVLLRYYRYAAGITFDKDAGEPIAHDDTLAMGAGRYTYIDPANEAGPIARRTGAFISAHAAAELGPVTLIAGDYSASFGHGLLLGESFGGFKSGEVADAPFARGRGLAPYRSSGESSFFRGGAVKLMGKGWLPGSLDMSIFVSSRRLDATIAPAPDGSSSAVVTAIRDDGYRRTLSELRHGGSLEERLAGVHIERIFRGGSLGITAYHAAYDAALPADPTPGPSGSAMTLVSIDGGYRLGRSMLTGEIARGDDGTIAAVGGIATRVGSVKLTVAGRWLPATFETPHGRTFSETPSHPGNEMGIYTALEGTLATGLAFGCYLDCYRVPEPTATVPLPRSGSDAYLRVDYAPARGVELHAHLHHESTDDPITITDSLGRARRRMIAVGSTSGRFEATMSTPGERIRLRGRYERRFIARRGGHPASDGLLAFVDARWAPSRRLAMGARMALFATDDFDAAIRELEGDLPGGFTSPALSGEGRRCYLYARWQPIAPIAISAKYAETIYTDRAVISQGDLQQIAGHMASSIAVQIDIGL